MTKYIYQVVLKYKKCAFFDVFLLLIFSLYVHSVVTSRYKSAAFSFNAEKVQICRCREGTFVPGAVESEPVVRF